MSKIQPATKVSNCLHFFAKSNIKAEILFFQINDTTLALENLSPKQTQI
jgi:hypothetical protein